MMIRKMFLHQKNRPHFTCVVDILMATLPGFFVINFFSIFFMLRVEQDVPIDNNDTINKTEYTILMNCFILIRFLISAKLATYSQSGTNRWIDLFP